MKIGHVEALEFGDAAVREYLAMLKQSARRLPAKMARWLSPSTMTPMWRDFLNHLIVLLPAGDDALQSFAHLKEAFRFKAADAVRGAYDIDPDQDMQLFMERVKRNLGLLLHQQRRYALYRSVQAYRLRVPSRFGPQGLPAQVRQAESQLRSSQNIDENHEHYKFWERTRQQDRRLLFGAQADRPILDQRRRNHMEVHPDPRFQYAPSATKERLDAMTQRFVHYEGWVPPLTSS